MAQRLFATLVLCSQVRAVSESQVWLQGHTGPDCTISTDFKHRRTAAGEGSFHNHWEEFNFLGAVQVSSDASASEGANFSTAIIKPVGFSAFLSLYLRPSNICLNLGSMKFYMYI